MTGPVLGVNLNHDMACAAVVDGTVHVAIEEERLVRVKHCSGRTHLGNMIPFAAIRRCLSELDISPHDVALWVANATGPGGADRVLQDRLIGIDPRRIVEPPYPAHHLAHAYSTFLPSPFSEAAVLILDVNGSASGTEKENFTILYGHGTSLTPVVKEYIRPGEVGIGELYTIYAAVLQLSPRPSGAYGKDDAQSSGGKLMGYAAYGATSDNSGAGGDAGEAFSRLIEPSGGRFVIGIPELVAHLGEQDRVAEVTNAAGLRQIYGWDIQRHACWRYREDSLHAARNIAFASEAQGLLEETVVRMAKLACDATGSTNLCLAGGTTLNTAAARRVLSDTPVRQLFVQPAANDAGTAIGCALYGYSRLAGDAAKRPYLEQSYSTFLGPRYRETDFETAAGAAVDGGCTASHVECEEEQIRLLVSSLADGHIVAVFRGRSEFGPRALGNRSLLASPGEEHMLERMNALKRREWYRPVAPIVLEEELDRHFDAPFTSNHFMTINALCREATSRAAPAIRHADGSARVQTVSSKSHSFLHRLLRTYADCTGQPPILVNTSLNVGEPIVETPTDAVRFLLQTGSGIGMMLLGDRVLVPQPQGAHESVGPEPAHRELATRY